MNKHQDRRHVVTLQNPNQHSGRPSSAHSGTYFALLLYPWVVWRRLTRVATCLLLGFWLWRGPKLLESGTGAEQPSMGASEELTATVAEIIHIDDKNQSNHRCLTRS